MQLRHLGLFLFFTPAGYLLAQDSSCARATTTLAQRECLSAQLTLADSAMGVLLDSLKRTLSDSSRAVLDKASLQWRAYRAAECDAVLQSYDGGSMGLVENVACYIALSDSRQKYLRAFFAGGDE